MASLFSSFICGSTFPWFWLVFCLGLWHKDGRVSRVFSRMAFSGYRPRTGIPRACGSIVFWFLKNLYSFSTDGRAEPSWLLEKAVFLGCQFEWEVPSVCDSSSLPPALQAAVCFYLIDKSQVLQKCSAKDAVVWRWG